MGKLVRASQRIITILVLLARVPFYFTAYFIAYYSHYVGILLLAVLLFCGLHDYRTEELAKIWFSMIGIWVVSLIGLYITWCLIPFSKEEKPEFYVWYDYAKHNPIRLPIILYKFLTAEFND